MGEEKKKEYKEKKKRIKKLMNIIMKTIILMIIPRKMKIGNNAKLNKLENNYDKDNKNLLR